MREPYLLALGPLDGQCVWYDKLPPQRLELRWNGTILVYVRENSYYYLYAGTGS